jgi:hypothetical protein
MRNRNRRRPALLTAAVGAAVSIFAASGEARAQVARSWIRPAGGDFNTSGNWDPFGAPGVNDGADFGLASTYTVNFATDRTTSGSYVGEGSVTFDLNAGGTARTYTVVGLDIIGFGGSTPTLLVRDGNLNAGSVTIRDAGHLHIGPDQGTGNVPVTMNVTSDLRVTSGGRLTLYDFHSNHVLNANANVLIDGGTMRTIGIGSGGFNLGPGRTITVQNAGSFEHGKVLRIEGSGLHVRAGGIVRTDGLDIATSTGAGSLVVEGTGSRLAMDLTFTQTGMQTWGAAGHAASVDVRDGASVSLEGGVYLGAQGGAGTSARFTVDGPGTTFAHTIVGAGQVIDQIVVGHASSGSAELTVRNGAAFTSEAGVAGGSKILVNPTGRISIESGATFSAARIERVGAGQFNMLGGTVRFGQFTGNLVNQAGTLRPGHNGNSAAFVEGHYTQQPAGSLAIDIGGVLPGQAQQAVVTGNAVIGGTLDLALVDDFVPIVGNTLTVLQTQFGNVGGRFARVNGTLPLPGIGLAVTYTPSQVLVRASLPGDANLDNAVNLQDFNILASNFGQSGRTWVQADFTGDGMVNLQDFNRLAGHFGLSAGPELTPEDWARLGSAIPEPTSCAPVLFGLAASAAMSARRRRNST